MYLIWHCQRAGWISKSHGTTTDIKEAQRFDRAVAVERARSTKDYQDNFMMIPVSEEDL